MRRRAAWAAIAAAGLFAPAVPLRAQAAAYPATAVLDAVRGACDRLASLEQAHAHVRAAGWTRVADAAGTPVGPLLAYGREQGEKFTKGRGSIEFDKGAYRKTVAGEELWLLLSGATVNGRTVHGCRIYDPGETRRISVKDAARWIGREPGVSVDRPELMRAEWGPGVNPGQDSFELFFVPADSPLREMTKLTGIAIKADWVGPPTSNP